MKMEYNTPKLFLGTMMDDWYDNNATAPTSASNA